MNDVICARLDRADPGPQRPSQPQQPPADLARRLLQQIAAGAIWAHATGWARNADVPDTTGTHLDPTQRATANAVLDLLADWRHGGAIAYAGAAGDDCMWRLELRPAGHALLADLWAGDL